MSENRATERLKYCDMEERSLLKRSRTQEEAEEDTDSPATKRRDLQPGPSSDPPVNQGVVGLPSSSSSCSSGEGSVNNKFAVFISHRGPDTKSNLAYPIYFLLQQRGVEAFLDREELQSGERFPEAIEKAIECSKVGVCILSSGFAESVWCLKELVMMLNNFEMCSSTLIPIFYDVEPAEVKYLKGAFGQGFENLQSKSRYSREDIEQWRLALHKIGEISGYQGKGELSMTIVKRICELLDIGCVDTPKNVMTREKELRSTIHDIMRCRNGLGVTLVEISGIGGIGKTTFAKELYNQIYTKYDRHCFIEDVNGLVEKQVVDEVHRQIFSKLFKDHQRYSTEGKKLLKTRLHNAEILVVIDNIHSKIPLSTVFIEDDVSLNPRSTIIVTSREEGVLKYDFGVKGYCQNLISLKMKKLDFYTSKKIFCHHAFGGIYNVKNEFNEMIEKIVKKCDGIPLALTLLGRHVYLQDIMFWKSLWSSIKDCLHGDVKKILKFSYDNLESKLEKCLFLDIATFFRWEKEDLLVNIRQQSDDEDGELQVQYALHILKRNLLIYVSNDGILGMHDVLVDLGRSIVKDEDLCPGHRSRVWSPSDVRLMLSDERGTEKVKALTLVSEGSPVLDEGQCPWSADVFSELSSLEILILHGHCIEGDFSKLSKRLLWLRWTNFPYQKIPLKLYIKHLRGLQVTGENMIRLWEHPPQEAPSKLRELIVQYCTKLQSLPESMEKLRQLTRMNLHNCTSLKIIPDSFGQLQALKHLEFDKCRALERLPETFGGLTGLHRLFIFSCPAMVSLPESLGDLTRLSELSINSCDAMVSLPESLGNLRSLSTLRIYSCPAMLSLPESVRKLVQLQSLDIYKCRALEGLPQSFLCWTNLVYLKVQCCDKRGLSLKQFQGIRFPSSGLQLEVDEEDAMEVAHSLFGSTDLRNFVQPIQIKQQKYTAGLLLAAANNNSNRCAPQLSDFELIAKHVINSADEMRTLDVGGLWNVKELALCHLRNLVTLELNYCYNLPKLSIGGLSFLTELSLRWCFNLKEVDSIGNLQNLGYLNIHSCLALKELPSCIGTLSRLEELCVADCWMMEVIHTQALFSLTRLEVSSCVNLSRIVGLSHLSRLEILDIKGCLNLRKIMEGPGHFNHLRRVDITGCYRLHDRQLSLKTDIFNQSHDEEDEEDEEDEVTGCYRLHDRQLSFKPNIFNQSDHKDTDVISMSHLFNLLSNDDEDTEEVLQWSLNANGGGILNVKMMPALSLVMEQKIKDLIGCQDMCCFFHKLPPKDIHGGHFLAVPFVPHVVVLCLTSSVYTADLPRHVPPPRTEFHFSTDYCKRYHRGRYGTVRYYYGMPGAGYDFERFDCGEEIHLAVLPFGVEGDIKSCDDDIYVNIEKGRLQETFWCLNNCHGPSCKALVKDGWIVYLGSRKEYLAKEICTIFYSEFRKQRLISCAWTQLPSQLHVYEFSALDIAGCQITKISHHGNTCIMEEESGLIWSKRRCLFVDDHALLLHHPKGSEHSFLAYPGIDRDLETIVANRYEMSISILVKGEVVSSRKLQKIIPIIEEEIPPLLNTLLQGRDFHSSQTMRRMKLLVRDKVKYKYFMAKAPRLSFITNHA